ncbi:MAG: hypothetical protein QOI20_2511, partial [Acidimicrobiaceae bacterium]|nr:hypothetical protein [Acidimicrobiaceae bacterium]
MRRLASVLGGALLAASAVIISGGAPAQASCPAGHGTAPTTVAKTYTVGAGGQTFYVDDRDFDDTDDSDGQAGGIWIYQEANGLGGLQRGGSQWVVAAIPVTLPYVAPTPVYTPAVGPAPSKGTTLFPTGFGGGSVADAAGEHDDCIEYDG